MRSERVRLEDIAEAIAGIEQALAEADSETFARTSPPISLGRVTLNCLLWFQGRVERTLPRRWCFRPRSG